MLSTVNRSQVPSQVTPGDFCYLRWASSLQCPLFHYVTIRRTGLLVDEELVSLNVDKVMMGRARHNTYSDPGAFHYNVTQICAIAALVKKFQD